MGFLRGDGRRPRIRLRRAQGVQIGDRNVQHVHVHQVSRQVAAPLDDALERLATLTREAWLAESARRGIVLPAPAAVRWRWGGHDLAAPTKQLVDPHDTVIAAPAPVGSGGDGLPGGVAAVLLGSGVVTRLHEEVYSRLPHGRLVVLGPAGSGKTGAMVLLLLAALRHRSSAFAPERARLPVPVWLTLGGWDPRETPLKVWAASVLTRDHPYLRAAEYGDDAAAQLLRSGRLALFLDGFDELPEGLRAEALSRLDAESIDLRIVMTSRPDEYREALARGRLSNAAVIELRPVRPRAAGEYLCRSRVGEDLRRWESVARHITDRPDGVLARTLDNPLTLSLARAAYVGKDPTELIDRSDFTTDAAVRRHLIDQVLVTAYPDARRRRRMVRRLAWIAHHLEDARDLAWWQIPEWVPRWRRLLVSAAGAALVAAACTSAVRALAAEPTAMIDQNGVRTTDRVTVAERALWALWGLEEGAVVGVLVALVTALVATGIVWRREPIALRARWPDARRWLRLAGWVLAFALAVAGLTGLLRGVMWFTTYEALDGIGPLVEGADAVRAWVTSLLWVGAKIGAPAGLVLGLRSLWATPTSLSAAATPRSILRDDRRANGLLALGVTVLVATAGAVGSVGAQRQWLGYGLVWTGVAMACGTATYLTIGSAGRLTAAGLAVRWRISKLLEGALERQVLRQSGTVYQFRHAELQQHLARLHTENPRAAGDPARFGRRIPGDGHRGGRRARRHRPALAAALVAVVLVSVLTPRVERVIHPDHLIVSIDHSAQAIAFSPDGDVLAAVASAWPRDGRGSLWLLESATGRLLRPPVSIQDGDVTAVAMGRGVVVTGGEQGVYLWEPSTGSPLGSLRPGSVASASTDAQVVVLSSEGALLAAASKEGVVNVWRLADRRRLFTLSDLAGWPAGLAFSPDSRRLAAVDSAGRVVVWDASTGQKLTGHQFWGSIDGRADARDLTFSPDSQTVAAVGPDGVATWNPTTDVAAHAGVGGYRLAFDPTGSRLVIIDLQYRIAELDATNFQPIRVDALLPMDVEETIAFSRDLSRLAAADPNGRIRIWSRWQRS